MGQDQGTGKGRAGAGRRGALKGREAGALAGIPAGMPALIARSSSSRKASKVGFDWNDPRAVLAKIREETDEIEGALDQMDQQAGVRRDRRPDVRSGQSGAAPRRRCRCGLARNQYQVRAPLPVDRGRPCQARQDAVSGDAGRRWMRSGTRPRSAETTASETKAAERPAQDASAVAAKRART